MTFSPTWFKSKTPQIALILITIIWGASFLTVQYGLNFSTPMLFVGLRFATAAFAIGLLSLKYLKGFIPMSSLQIFVVSQPLP